VVSRSALAPGLRKTINLLGSLTILLIVFAAIELASYVFLVQTRKQHGQFFHFDIDRYVDELHPAQLEARKRGLELKHIWAPDPGLGWRRTPLSSHVFAASGTTINTDSAGARVIPGATGPVSIATYGDSFTEGLEVDDGETWQAYIASASGTRVLNYGVSAYGPDQALLALEANLEHGVRAPVVILAMINENLNRMMNTFRLFYTYPSEDVFLGFKPIFAPTDSGFRVTAFAPADIADRGQVRRALWAASEYDWFYQHRTYHIRFPFSLCAARFIARNGVHPTYPWPDYSEGLPRARMKYILERFHADSRKYRFTPVFLLLPESTTELERRRGYEHPVFSAIVREANLPGLVYIDVAKELSSERVGMYAANFTSASYIRITHPSPAGNQAIANVVIAALRDQVHGGRGSF
jgi:hypothetical protein